MKRIIYLFAVVLMMQGIGFFIHPDMLFAMVGGLLEKRSTTTDVRATYGGIHFAMGIFLLWSNRNEQRRVAAFVLLTITIGVVALVRAIGVVIDGGEQEINIVAAGFEFIMAVFTAYCAIRLRRQLSLSRS